MTPTTDTAKTDAGRELVTLRKLGTFDTSALRVDADQQPVALYWSVSVYHGSVEAPQQAMTVRRVRSALQVLQETPARWLLQQLLDLNIHPADVHRVSVSGFKASQSKTLLCTAVLYTSHLYVAHHATEAWEWQLRSEARSVARYTEGLLDRAERMVAELQKQLAYLQQLNGEVKVDRTQPLDGEQVARVAQKVHETAMNMTYEASLTNGYLLSTGADARVADVQRTAAATKEAVVREARREALNEPTPGYLHTIERVAGQGS